MLVVTTRTVQNPTNSTITTDIITIKIIVIKITIKIVSKMNIDKINIDTKITTNTIKINTNANMNITVNTITTANMITTITKITTNTISKINTIIITHTIFTITTITNKITIRKETELSAVASSLIATSNGRNSPTSFFPTPRGSIIFISIMMEGRNSTLPSTSPGGGSGVHQAGGGIDKMQLVRLQGDEMCALDRMMNETSQHCPRLFMPIETLMKPLVT
ncbi:hypothetical protein GUITHDRAFT_105017 [Guillardia theta CCMP2712]|uniref:Uncharacterized protein n=1 Tax=Guillardia theta (strain CCMP2712) TaxID=905079 RepID=L1JM52_GUITC|nr:hypothetical protein GUITHDRAFT_105017 [Guillardia theta CCMP2712]EKX49492.1 hypothetical protein GUITHDRAFT_105017 [Guillardia theta CCMP2712]|eukprot:XP_005836472.1 hypothetical protein GUITHDRAFT_105017 [Guillardia theta CCMP2712]